jgi:hypothetical protein
VILQSSVGASLTVDGDFALLHRPRATLIVRVMTFGRRAMKRIILAIGFSATLAIVQTSNAHPESAAVIAKQQLTDCMNKRMAASRSVSYNEAMRVCKEKQQAPKDTLASNGPSETATKSH